MVSMGTAREQRAGASGFTREGVECVPSAGARRAGPRPPESTARGAGGAEARGPPDPRGAPPVRVTSQRLAWPRGRPPRPPALPQGHPQGGG